ncbi:translation initiation factor IF-2 [Thermodesulfobium narugense DSM 14796]|uniref:Translation initiation factor IF-2 n=1 Tax=Thermodesulfobium narugense DSM 14796 TaxID=747365 RepID=M1E824_9BACT|nr:translation initiation factor IF-2 [Thermodesulfobium narugense]AEE14244.1 translation initiation factor IF-2 [Thermodesulfobium narugense DSM 14796]
MKRIYELSRELGVSSKKIIEILSGLGVTVKSSLSSVGEEEEFMVRSTIEAENKVEVSKETKKEEIEKVEVENKDLQKENATKVAIKEAPELATKEKETEVIEEPKVEEKKILYISDGMTPREIAQKINVKESEVIKKLIKLKTLATINQALNISLIESVVKEFGYEPKLKEEESLTFEETEVENVADLQPRPPIVTVMGHVDHGKTTLLDKIQKTKIASKEFRGITQKIGAYQVEINGKKITFIDTPGHEAFTAMRARGANVTDIVILVVAADDGVKPQTIEAIQHAKAAGVQIMVAINKIDKPGAQPEKIMQQLTEYGLIPEEWGGKTIFVKVSAKTGEGIDELLEMILLLAEIMEYKANPKTLARGLVLEAKLEKNRGPVATVLIQKGTLRVGDFVCVGAASGKVRALINDRGKRLKEAGPSTPVEILGINMVPEAGDSLIAVKSDKEAKLMAEKMLNRKKELQIQRMKKPTLSCFVQGTDLSEVKELKLILKADSQGSLEAILTSLAKIKEENVTISILSSGTGGISESDVMLASASQAIIIGFNVRPSNTALKLASEEGIDIRTYRVIYDLIEDISKAIKGLLPPKYEETILGRAEVRQTFKVPKIGLVAGCYVVDGKVTRDAKVRVLRDNVIIHEGELSSLKRFKDDVKEVNQGYECGISIKDFHDIKENDIFEIYKLVEVAC